MIKLMKEYDVGQPFIQCRTATVNLGDGKKPGRVFLHGNTDNLDPWTESMHFPQDTLKLTVIDDDGKMLFQKDLGPGVIPGIWFEPMITFDLDGDGVDEIWLLDNLRPRLPFSFDFRILERIDPRTGEVTGQWPWPKDLVTETMSHCFRFYLIGGYANGEPVLVTAQGTYTDMYLQGWNKGMEQRWSIKIDKDEPGARASHHTHILDMNHDGIDEIFYGERVLSIDDGHELCCGDRDLFNAHSDILIPFDDPETGKRYYFTGREGNHEVCKERVVLYDENMNTVWRFSQGGHIHRGWIAQINDDHRYTAMAMSFALEAQGADRVKLPRLYYYFDAVSGKQVEPPFPQYEGEALCPIDFNGDAYSEFLLTDGPEKGLVIDRKGNPMAHLDGKMELFGQILPDTYGQQVLMLEGDKGLIRIYGDDEAVPGPCDKYKDFHALMQHMMASGYNRVNANYGM